MFIRNLTLYVSNYLESEGLRGGESVSFATVH
jgi:hypothetical protein